MGGGGEIGEEQGHLSTRTDLDKSNHTLRSISVDVHLAFLFIILSLFKMLTLWTLNLISKGRLTVPSCRSDNERSFRMRIFHEEKVA